MRILNILFDDRYGGPQKRVIQTAQKLEEFGIATIACFPDRGGNAPKLAIDAGIDVRLVTCSRIPNLKSISSILTWIINIPFDLRAFYKLIQNEKPDIIHVNGAFFLAPAIVAKLMRRPLVWHLNDTIAPNYAAYILGIIVKNLSTQVVVAAHAVANHYHICNFPYNVIYAPVNLEIYTADNRYTEKKLIVGSTTKRVGLIANWNPIKGVEYFIRAAALLKQNTDNNLEFVFAGEAVDTQKEYAQEIETLIDKLRLRNSVKINGYVESINELLTTLDVLVLSSLSEACPMAVLEAMAAGVPIVATNVGGVRELLHSDSKTECGILVQPRDPQAIADAIAKILSNYTLAKIMGQNGRRIAKEKFSLYACAIRHYKVYSKCVEYNL